jgi:hypothetical protein
MIGVGWVEYFLGLGTLQHGAAVEPPAVVAAGVVVVLVVVGARKLNFVKLKFTCLVETH